MNGKNNSYNSKVLDIILFCYCLAMTVGTGYGIYCLGKTQVNIQKAVEKIAE